MSQTSESEETKLKTMVKELKLSHDIFVNEQKMRKPTLDRIDYFVKNIDSKMSAQEKLLEDVLQKLSRLEGRL